MKNNTINQSGRSMIEMLGVLAIVGVLSVGGIAGYSKAMQKYRTNKTIEQVTQIINGVRTLYSQQKSYEGITAQYSGPLRKAKILPESAWESTASNATPKNPFGGDIKLLSSYKNTGDNSGSAFILEIHSIPEDACIELATQDWGDATGFTALSVNLYGTITIDDCVSSSSDGNYALRCAKDGSMPIDDAMLGCKKSNNVLLWRAY